MRISCDPFLIFSDFDSGNILTAESVEKAHSHVTHQHEYELDIFTKPDCHGSIYQNGNRTWFHFGMQGGKPGAVVKLNILNLNKQIKLFSQGMQPVFRYLPERPNWERVRDKLIINEKEEHVCSISFRQRLPEDTSNSVLHIAFTYPLSYVEMTEWLDSLVSVYAQTKAQGLPFYINQTLNPNPSRAELLMLQSAKLPKNQIYFYRECVTYSLEGRRIELITITSCQGMSEDREERLSNLFPLGAEERPYKFPEKKIIFLSARVHPGETPSSFVLNGVFKFLLEPTDPRALLLRTFFVFKLIPMLNPDGVARGHYRTDSRGINLNRQYLQPSAQLHPSIYASRKLLLYYHHGREIPDEYDVDNSESHLDMNPQLQSAGILDKSPHPHLTGLTEENLYHSIPPVPVSENIVVSQHENIVQPALFANRFREESFERRCSENSTSKVLSKLSQNNSSQNEDSKMFGDGSEHCESRSTTSSLCEENVESTFEACDEDSLVYVTDIKHHQAANRSESEEHTSQQSLSPRLSAKRKERSVTKKRRKKSRTGTSNHSTSWESQLFCYIDMHGHATKRGIFMYGNHFSDPLVQAECMLLPKLMSMNCPHFDFSACNFTERLMNLKDRRDGASREGSGRVAIFKLTGLVRSYTLECNYNTGRQVNNVVNRGPVIGLQDRMRVSPHPPKFTPELFEDAGKALAESLLDLINRNPWSRVGFSEYRTVDGMRQWLLKRIQPVEVSTSDLQSVTRKASVGPLVPKKENHNSAILLEKPCSSKSLRKTFQLFDKPTSSSSVKLKGKGSAVVPTLESKSSMSSNTTLLQVFKVKKKTKKKHAKKNSTV